MATRGYKMTDNRFTVIKTFHNLVDAKVAKSKLDAYQINSWLDNENVSSLNWFYINATGGMKLRVEEKDAKQAIEILGDITDEPTSARTIFTRNSNKARIAWATIIALLLGLLFFGIF